MAEFLRPYRTGETNNSFYTTPAYGENEYRQALSNWQNQYGTYSDIVNKAKSAIGSSVSYFSPGGGYGTGQRKESEELIQSGVNKDLSQMVAIGMSSQAGAKGLQTLANTQLGKMYSNIEDRRAELLMQAITPYAQIAQSIASMASTMPAYKQYVTTPQTIVNPNNVTNSSEIAAILQAHQQAIDRNQARNTF